MADDLFYEAVNLGDPLRVGPTVHDVRTFVLTGPCGEEPTGCRYSGDVLSVQGHGPNLSGTLWSMSR